MGGRTIILLDRIMECNVPRPSSLAEFIVSASSSPHTHTKQQSSQPGKLLSSAGFSFQDTQVPNTHGLKRAGLWWGFVGLLNVAPPLERNLSTAALEHNSQLQWCRCKPVTGYCCCKHLASLETLRKLRHFLSSAHQRLRATKPSQI